MTTQNTVLPTGIWTIDPAHTDVAFVARHLMVTKVRGRFPSVTGTITVGDRNEDSEATVTVDMASITTGAPDRDAHLRSADFFDVENHPTMTFTSTSFTGDTLTGNLTIKDVTKPVTFDVEFNGTQTDPWGGTRAGFEAETEVNRKDWDLTWNTPLEGGGVLVSDKVKLIIDVQLVRQA